MKRFVIALFAAVSLLAVAAPVFACGDCVGFVCISDPLSGMSCASACDANGCICSWQAGCIPDIFWWRVQPSRTPTTHTGPRVQNYTLSKTNPEAARKMRAVIDQINNAPTDYEAQQIFYAHFTSITVNGEKMSGVMAQEPVTPTRGTSWGAVKILYR